MGKVLMGGGTGSNWKRGGRNPRHQRNERYPEFSETQRFDRGATVLLTEFFCEAFPPAAELSYFEVAIAPGAAGGPLRLRR